MNSGFLPAQVILFWTGTGAFYEGQEEITKYRSSLVIFNLAIVLSDRQTRSCFLSIITVDVLEEAFETVVDNEDDSHDTDYNPTLTIITKYNNTNSHKHNLEKQVCGRYQLSQAHAFKCLQKVSLQRCVYKDS